MRAVCRPIGHLAVALAVGLGQAAGAAEAPSVLSLDYCADQYVLGLADPDQIRAVSREADNDYSHLRARTAGLAQARPVAEDVLAHHPDIVVRSWGGGARVRAYLERFGVEVVQLSPATDFDGVRADIETVARALGQEPRGAALIADMEARLAALAAARPPEPPAALYITSGGVTAGGGTFVQALFQAAGVRNAASEAGTQGWAPAPLEALVMEPPQMVVAAFFDTQANATDRWSATRHPALQRVLARTPTHILRSDLIACPAWFSVGAAEAIAADARGPDL